MAASGATILDAAASGNPARAGSAEPHADGASSGAAMATMTAPNGATAQPQGEETKQFAPGDAPTAAPTEIVETTTSLVVDTSGNAIAEAPVKKATPTGSRAKNALGITTSKKKGKKKSPAASHPSVGISVDALDKNKMWGNGRIIEVDVAEQRLKITFPGFSKNWDIWTDMLSIAPHCRCSNYPRRNARSWDGKTNLFTGERIKTEDDDDEEGDDDAYASPERVQASPPEEVVLAPSKPPVRKPKKGYVLVPVTEGDLAASSSSQQQALKPEKLRKSSATLKREAAQPLEGSIGASPKPPKKARAPREPRVPAVAPTPVREPFNDPDLARQRAQNELAMNRSATFLSQCAELWKQQLTAMSELDRKALFVDKEVDENPNADAVEMPVDVVLESTVV